MSWRDEVDFIDGQVYDLDAFGEPVTYYALHGEADPITIRAIRGTRDPIEGDRLAPMERIWARASSFPNPPQKGDVVALDSDPTEYVVFDILPDIETASDGLRLYLQRRRAAPSA